MEEETLEKIKFVLSCNNDAQAIRLIEQYGQFKAEKTINKYTLKVMEWYRMKCAISNFNIYISAEKALELYEAENNI